MVAAVGRHVSRGQLEAYLAQGDRCGWCRHPIRLRGFALSGPAGSESVSFTSLSLPDGVLLKACGSRSEVRCPSCAAVYRGDSRHLVRAGLEGGKGIDASRTRVRMSNWRHKVWEPAALELDLASWATPYVLRHTAASLMAQQGVPVSAAAAALGHDPAIFLRTYGHLYPGDLRGVADAMDVARQSAREGAVTLPTGQISRGDFAGTNRPTEFPTET